MKEKFKDTKGLDKAYMSLAKHYDEHKENAIRQAKDGTFVDLPNKETEELKKANAIAEMAVIGCVRNPQAHTAEECAKCDFKHGMCNAYGHAKALYNADYRKIGKDSIVISREEYEKLKS